MYGKANRNHWHCTEQGVLLPFRWLGFVLTKEYQVLFKG